MKAEMMRVDAGLKCAEHEWRAGGEIKGNEIDEEYWRIGNSPGNKPCVVLV